MPGRADDSADRTTTHLGGEFLLHGQAREARVLGLVGTLGFALGIGWRDLPCGARPQRGWQADGRWHEVLAACGAPAQPGFQCRRPRQAIGDAGEDDGEIVAQRVRSRRATLPRSPSRLTPDPGPPGHQGPWRRLSHQPHRQSARARGPPGYERVADHVAARAVRSALFQHGGSSSPPSPR
jgi:hypothetical protein